ncbi:hypothetical protein [Prochlorococcus marinus]|uniref:hypothetical protein n=1 Tax=Prochlorococcus TaxID=1218 RepID=UPI001F2A8482|nr:hypothetical protein [Prochlorococcus marinus]
MLHSQTLSNIALPIGMQEQLQQCRSILGINEATETRKSDHHLKPSRCLGPRGIRDAMFDWLQL